MNGLLIRGMTWQGGLALGGFAVQPVCLPHAVMGAQASAFFSPTPSVRVFVRGGGRSVSVSGGGRSVTVRGGGRSLIVRGGGR